MDHGKLRGPDRKSEDSEERMKIHLGVKKLKLGSRMKLWLSYQGGKKIESREEKAQGYFGDLRVNFTARKNLIGSGDLRTQLKAFVGGVCWRSKRFFLALFSRINLKSNNSKEFPRLPSNLGSS